MRTLNILDQHEETRKKKKHFLSKINNWQKHEDLNKTRQVSCLLWSFSFFSYCLLLVKLLAYLCWIKVREVLHLILYWYRNKISFTLPFLFFISFMAFFTIFVVALYEVQPLSEHNKFLSQHTHLQQRWVVFPTDSYKSNLG